MVQPTTTDIHKAKEYLLRRLDAEIKMEHYLDNLLVKAALEIVKLSYEYKVAPNSFSFSADPILSHQVEQVILRLRQQIEEYDIFLALSTDRMDEEKLTAHIFREINGATYGERLNLYVERFKKEQEAIIAAALIAGFGQRETFKELVSHYKNPRLSKLVPVNQWQGATSYSRLSTLVRHTIADAWMYADMEYHMMRGAIGFVSRRGSSYPCQVCDDMASYFHTYADPYPPYHPHCVCYAIPVYQPQNL